MIQAGQVGMLLVLAGLLLVGCGVVQEALEPQELPAFIFFYADP